MGLAQAECGLDQKRGFPSGILTDLGQDNDVKKPVTPSRGDLDLDAAWKESSFSSRAAVREQLARARLACSYVEISLCVLKEGRRMGPTRKAEGVARAPWGARSADVHISITIRTTYQMVKDPRRHGGPSGGARARRYVASVAWLDSETKLATGSGDNTAGLSVLGVRVRA